MLDFNKITAYEGMELAEVVSVIQVNHDRAPSDLVITVLHHAGGTYTAVANYALSWPGQACPYKSSTPQTTVDEALSNTLSSLNKYMQYENIQWVNDKGIILEV